MLHLTLRSLWARKRRLVGTSLAVILGVGFLAAIRRALIGVQQVIPGAKLRVHTRPNRERK